MPEAADKDNFLTSREAAMLLGVSLRTVQLWVENGMLKAWKTAGGHRRIDRNSVEELCAEKRRTLARENKTLMVVIVEDDPVQNEIYQYNFEDWSLPVDLVFANDGFEGLLEIGRLRPDVVISDLNMPGMDGFQMIRAIGNNEKLRHTKVIAVTSYTEQQVEQRGGLPANALTLYKSSPFNVLEKLMRDIYMLIYGGHSSDYAINEQINE